MFRSFIYSGLMKSVGQKTIKKGIKHIKVDKKSGIELLSKQVKSDYLVS